MELELKRTLSAELFSRWVSNAKIIKDTLENKGYGIPLEASDVIEFWDTVDWQMFLIQAKAGNESYSQTNGFLGLFNSVEILIDNLDSVCDWLNPYTKEPYSFKKKNGILYPYVKRWFDWLNYNLDVINGNEPKYQYLYTIENGVEEQLFDINGDSIITGESF